ncbi:MAG: hypothetical protein QOK05_1498 [Chloroflexota bacterium]|nr:hypothetical protein [Chloroflexota bacterium]
MTEDEESELEAMMRQRRVLDSRLNRALGELLGSGKGGAEAVAAIEEAETLLRALAGFVGRLQA